MDLILLVFGILLVIGVCSLPALLKHSDRNDGNLHGKANSITYWSPGS